MSRKSRKAANPKSLRRQEEELANREIELALRDARVRGRESQMAGQMDLLGERAQWIEDRVSEMSRWVDDTSDDEQGALEMKKLLRGLGDGAARKEADLNGYVSRSKTLMVARAAIAAQRFDVLQRREEQLDDRDAEVGTCEEAVVRAEVRIAARERMVIEAIQRLEQMIGGKRSSNEGDMLRRAMFGQIATMSVPEGRTQDKASRKGRRRTPSKRPPVLDMSVFVDD
jgi:hypothetical protein